MKRKKREPQWLRALREAIEIAGSQYALARRIYGDDWKEKRPAITVALKSKGISAVMARQVSDATGVALHRFRPDLWPLHEQWGKHGE